MGVEATRAGAVSVKVTRAGAVGVEATRAGAVSVEVTRAGAVSVEETRAGAVGVEVTRLGEWVWRRCSGPGPHPPEHLPASASGHLTHQTPRGFHKLRR